MPKPFVEIRRRALILDHDDEDDEGDSGGLAGEAGAGGSRSAEEERSRDLGRDPLAPSSSSQPVAAVRGPEVILIDDDDKEEETEVAADGGVQLGEGGGLVKEEAPSDSDVDWDELDGLFPSDEERKGKASTRGDRRIGASPSGSPRGEVRGGTSRGTGTGQQEGACEGEEEEGDEVGMDLEDNDGAEEGQDQEGDDKDEDEWEVEEEEEEEDDDEDTEDEAESEAEEDLHRLAPSNARAAGRYAGDSATEVFLRRKFEGWLISKIADTTAAGSTVAARTRSRRRCPDRKLLKRGTCSKPYTVDTASEESGWESEEDDVPPPAPALSSGEERELDGGGRGSYRRTVAGKRRRRGKKPARGDDSSESEYGDGQGVVARRWRKFMKDNAANGNAEEPGGGGGEDRETAARRRGKRPMEPSAAAHGHGGGDESDEDRPFECSQKPKKGAASCAFKNKGTPMDGFDQHQHGDVNFKKCSLVFPKGQGRRERETYDDLLDTIFEGIENYQNGSAPPDASVPPAQGQGHDTLPLVFAFSDEEEVIAEKTDHENVMEELFGDWDDILVEEQEQSANAPAHTHEKDEKSNMHEIPADGATSRRCKPGKHVLFLDDQIGIRCQICGYIEMEIRDVFPAMMKDFTDREPAADRELDLLFDDILKSIGHEGASNVGGHKTGVVWDLIPGVREDMFPHQQEGFEFMWKRLAGGIDIEQLKEAMNSDTTSGCVISHAPGTGKTRLAITFVQSYLEIFPHCRPVIIAPRGMLATWEQEFRKWKVKLPFHVLSSNEIQWNEDKTIQKMVSRDENLRQKLSAKKLSQKSTLMLKLASWYEGSSIIGLSYSLYRNLAKGEGTDGKTVRNLLLEKPGLLVLDEGHTPRNKKSLIWKVLAEVSTEKRIILSGTPFQNNFLELYNILCLVKPKFARDFACTRLSKKGQSRAAPHLEEDEGKEFWTSLRISNITDENIREIREKLDPFVHIHNGDILQKSLPGLSESVVILNPLPRQKEIIAMMEKSAGKGFLDAEYKISLASIHPYLVTGTKLSDEEASIVEKMKSVRLNPCEGVKTWFVLEVIRLCEALKERVLVFSQYLEPLALIMDQLTSKFKWTEGKEILLMSGNVRVKQREALMEDFNDMNSEAKVMLASTKACCEGITLVGASRVVLLDVVWNPSVGRQAIGRAYRIGQEKIVYTYNLIAEGTKEKVKYDRQASKDHMSKLLFSNEPQPAESNQAQEMIFNDRVLKTMTEREDLKDMFVQITH